MHWGIDAAILREGGFVSLTDDADLVVPNYFSPFERHNVQVELAVKVLDDDTPEPALFRADADQTAEPCVRGRQRADASPSSFRS